MISFKKKAIGPAGGAAAYVVARTLLTLENTGGFLSALDTQVPGLGQALKYACAAIVHSHETSVFGPCFGGFWAGMKLRLRKRKGAKENSPREEDSPKA